MAYSMFPTPGHQVLSALIHFLGITILTFFFARRVVWEDFNAKQAFSLPNWSRLCALLVFFDSYLFLLSTGLLIFGVGLQMNRASCAAGIYLCILFYTTSKILIYAFLSEKVYIVWDNGTRRTRMRSPVYIICIGTICLYLAVILAVFFGRVQEFRSGDGACVLGLKPTASFPLLSYDLYISILLTGLFVWPLLRSSQPNARLRRVAMRTLVASAVALTTSTVNITLLAILKGRELGWVCLGSCGADVIFNAAALFWVTSGSGTTSTTSSSGVDRDRRQVVTDSLNNHNVIALSVPTSPSRKSHATTNTFQMTSYAPKPQEFKIHVSTESQVSRSPSVSGLGEDCK
ncbi:hypothetical protein C8J57DRAFT_626980 [Mycena rebaudengoi]|nr:hypothetical protein C8J57DRAFT_626980 [Mycena rebaudengoi]